VGYAVEHAKGGRKISKMSEIRQNIAIFASANGKKRVIRLFPMPHGLINNTTHKQTNET
jgi:hypothetical protein